MKAVSTSTAFRVTFDEGNRNYIIQYQTTAGLKDDGDMQTLSKGITMTVNFGELNYAAFNPNSTSSSPNVRLGNGRESNSSLHRRKGED